MMANLEEMSRVLYSHDWARVQDWVTALDQLATLTDDEIATLVHQDSSPRADEPKAYFAEKRLYHGYRSVCGVT
jgi:hypothetical protein